MGRDFFWRCYCSALFVEDGINKWSDRWSKSDKPKLRERFRGNRKTVLLWGMVFPIR
ncbi:MAG: hypothetical protein M3342_03460 [Bacteroidota bacterium]|nr:hypothetical protein [Bacteroidota bacterium]